MSAEGGDGFLGRWARRKAEARIRSGTTTVSPALDELAVDETKPVAPMPVAPMQVAPTQVADPAPRTARASDAAGSLAAAPPAASPTVPAAATAPLPTLADVAVLTRDSDYTRFMASGVDSGVRNAAMKKLFADPHFNVMDGLDTYIDDYGKPDPIPLSMLRQMNQSKALGLFADEERAEADRAAAMAGSADVPHGTDAAPSDDPEKGAAPLVASSALAEDASAGRSGASDERRADDDADLRLQQDDGPRRDGAAPGPRA